MSHSKSIRSSAPDFDRSPKLRIERFQRLDGNHIKALESVLDTFPILRGRMEVHLPGHRAKQIFQNETLWVWPKFDRRPAQYLFFIEGFPPCMWDVSRQEGYTLRWILPPGLSVGGPTVCLANLLKSESVLQIEDILIKGGRDLWSSVRFSARWEELRSFWTQLPADQPLLSITPRIVQPIPLEQWQDTYDASLSWIIQSDCVRSPRWFWWDSITPVDKKPYDPPALKRATAVTVRVCALAKPYTKLFLPDTYMLYAQDGTEIGIAGIRSLAISQTMRQITGSGSPVEVTWDEDFNKYQIIGLLPENTPISAVSFFPNAKQRNEIITP
jgi:hypothetical protein